MTLPHRLIIDGVEQCASDDAGEFLRLAYQYPGDLEKETGKEKSLPDPVTSSYIAYVMER